ncbi:MAG: RimK family alpha-L-glutamate ligase [Clostridia bacterium]|nr:RimK family alpha-L-glutamate ligase [Clostridia bacterium]
MKGYIIINPYLVPKESVYQAERLKEEFGLLGVCTEIVSDAFLQSELIDGKISAKLKDADFAVYLDKDKYQSEILSRTGVRVFNSHEAIRLCDDKAVTYIALSGSSLNIPKTLFGALCYRNDLAVNKEWADEIGDKLGYPVIVKESFGSMGKGVHKADTPAELIAIMKRIKLKPHLFQEYLESSKGRDVRVIVIGGKAIAAMERRNESDFRSNVAQGGTGVNIELPEKFKAVAEKCARVLRLDYCGVDLLYGKDGEPVVCEVNSNAFISGIENTTGVNVARAYAEYIVNTIKK